MQHNDRSPFRRAAASACSLALAFLAAACATTPPLPSWRDGPARAAILDFVARTTDAGSADFVPPAERIAVFDNDGTLWAEQPAYFQLFFAVDRVKQLAPQHPEWTTQEPFRSVLAGDLKQALAGGEKAVLALVAASHAGLTTDAFDAAVKAWFATARHPTTGRPFAAMVYEPMRELLAHLRAHGYQTWIVSGGGIDFMRPWTEAVYGIPPQQVIGSSLATKLEERAGVPVLVKTAELGAIDDKDGKPIHIHRHIGRRPTAAFGNSDGDLRMLQWTAAGSGPRFCLLVHHTDAVREWAYDRASPVGKLDAGLAEAASRGWTVVDMARDWAQVFAPADGGDAR